MPEQEATRIEVAEAALMRDAAKRMLDDEDARWHRVGHWLNAEAWLWEGMEPFVELLAAAIKGKDSEAEAALRLVRTESGAINMQADSASFGLAVARSYLGAPSPVVGGPREDTSGFAPASVVEKPEVSREADDE